MEIRKRVFRTLQLLENNSISHFIAKMKVFSCIQYIITKRKQQWHLSYIIL